MLVFIGVGVLFWVLGAPTRRANAAAERATHEALPVE